MITRTMSHFCHNIGDGKMEAHIEYKISSVNIQACLCDSPLPDADGFSAVAVSLTVESIRSVAECIELVFWH